jgi:hypothetical protein
MKARHPPQTACCDPKPATIRKALGWTRNYVSRLWDKDEATIAAWETDLTACPAEYCEWLQACQNAMVAQKAQKKRW